MSNVISMFDALEAKMKKHMDLAEVWLESGDMVAYEDHMKIAESILVRLQDL